MTQLFLGPILFLALIVLPVVLLRQVDITLKYLFNAETRPSKILGWADFIVSSLLFLIAGTVVLNVFIVSFTGGTVTAP